MLLVFRLHILASLLLLTIAAPYADYCWEFSADSNSVSDACGAAEPLMKTAGVNGGPFCDKSGCTFQQASYYEGTLPSQLDSTWTITVWATFSHSNNETLISILDAQREIEIARLQREESKLRLVVESGSGVRNNPIGWGSQYWIFLYINSDESDNLTQFGALTDQGYSTFFVAGTTNLTNSQYLRVGNSLDGLSPSRLMKRVEIYRDTYYPRSSPYSTTDIVNAKYCISINTAPLCNANYLYLKMNPSYIQRQVVIDVSNAQRHGTNGPDQSDAQDATVGEVGLDFSGNELVSVKDLNISPYSFTIQVWLLFDSNHISADQTILRDVNNRLRIGVTPSAGEVAVEFENYPYSVGNLPIDASGWNFIAIALSMSSADQRHLLTIVNGDVHQTEIPGSPFSLMQINLGESFFGTMRQFIIYERFMGLESFTDREVYNKICAIGEFYNEYTRTCQACNEDCRDCRSSANQNCGACVAPSFLKYPGIPGVCADYTQGCDVSCATCDGSQPSNCISCASGYFSTFTQFSQSGSCVIDCAAFGPSFQLQNGQCIDLTYGCDQSCNECTGPNPEECTSCALNYNQLFLPGESGTCISNCADFDPDYISQDGTCVLRQENLVISKEQVVQNPHRLVILLSHVVLFNNLSLNDLTFEFQDISQNEFNIEMTPLFHSVGSTIEIFLNPQVDLQGDQSIRVFIESQSSIQSTNQIVKVPSSLVSNSIQLPEYMIPRSKTSNSASVSLAGAVVGSAVTITVILFSILQCCFQMSSGPLWALINLNQILFFCPLISLDLPENALTAFQILSFAVGDLFFLKLLYSSTIGLVLTGSEHGPYTPRYALQAYTSIAVLDASGVFLMILLYEFCLIAIYLFLRKMLQCSRCAVRRLTKNLNGLRWGTIIRCLIEAYIEIYLFSLLNLLELKFNNLTQLISTSLAVGLSITLTFLPFGFLNILNKPNAELKDEHSSTYQKYSEIYINLNYQKNFFSRHYQFFFILRRQIIIYTLAFLVGRGYLQLAIQMLATIFELYLLIKTQPFSSKLMNRVSIMNQFFLFAIYSFYFPVQLSSDPITQHFYGWFIVGLIGMVNFINIGLIIFLKIIECKCGRCKCCRRQPKIRTLMEMQNPDDEFRTSTRRPSLQKSKKATKMGHRSNQSSVTQMEWSEHFSGEQFLPFGNLKGDMDDGDNSPYSRKNPAETTPNSLYSGSRFRPRSKAELNIKSIKQLRDLETYGGYDDFGAFEQGLKMRTEPDCVTRFSSTKNISIFDRPDQESKEEEKVPQENEEEEEVCETKEDSRRENQREIFERLTADELQQMNRALCVSKESDQRKKSIRIIEEEVNKLMRLKRAETRRLSVKQQTKQDRRRSTLLDPRIGLIGLTKNGESVETKDVLIEEELRRYGLDELEVRGCFD